MPIIFSFRDFSTATLVFTPFSPAPLAYWRFESLVSGSPDVVDDLADGIDFGFFDLQVSNSSGLSFVSALVGNGMQCVPGSFQISQPNGFFAGSFAGDFAIAALFKVNALTVGQNQVVWSYPASTIFGPYPGLEVVPVTGSTYHLRGRISAGTVFAETFNVGDTVFIGINNVGGVVTGYVNGGSAQSLGTGITPGDADSFYVANFQTAFRFRGTVDEIALFSGALSEAEFAEMYARFLTATPLMQ